jgi:hypothetical protein
LEQDVVSRLVTTGENAVIGGIIRKKNSDTDVGLMEVETGMNAPPLAPGIGSVSAFLVKSAAPHSIPLSFNGNLRSPR